MLCTGETEYNQINHLEVCTNLQSTSVEGNWLPGADMPARGEVSGDESKLNLNLDVRGVEGEAAKWSLMVGSIIKGPYRCTVSNYCVKSSGPTH